ncbi:hypothetical protein FACS1894106_2330 [Spirochaetia bacterium]|nr:hypothetical protein FACS1894106_2330 [Spirochaetia bacterium]
MKKLLACFIVLSLVSFAVYAEDGLTFGGEVKTGLNITGQSGGGQPKKDAIMRVKNTDDASQGEGPGRVRANFTYTKGIIQFKWRFEVDANADTFTPNINDTVKFIYATGDFFDNQLHLSIGKLGGENPFETGGDEIWTNVNEDGSSGIKAEWKPKFLPGLDLGILFPAATNSKAPNIGQYLSETSLLARYNADILDLRLGFQFDGDGDGESAKNTDGTINHDLETESGAKLVYRLDPKLSRIVPGFQVWANGVFNGLPVFVDGVPESKLNTQNWLYIKYASGNLTNAQLRLGFETRGKNPVDNSVVPMTLNIRPRFGYKILDWMEVQVAVNAALNLKFEEDYKVAGLYEPSAFDSLYIEPKLVFNLGGGATIAPLYGLTVNPANSKSANSDEAKLTHTFEVRFVYSF